MTTTLLRDVQTSIRNITDVEFEELVRFVNYDERARREKQRQTDEAAETIITELQDSGRLEKPAAVAEDVPVEDKTADDFPAWKDPGTIHADMYRKGDKVRHRDRIWESKHPFLNSWEPGAQGVDHRIWRDITDKVKKSAGGNSPTPNNPDNTPPVWKAGVWKAGVSYKVGDKVKYRGRTYRVVQPHTSQSDWAPDKVPALFAVA